MHTAILEVRKQFNKQIKEKDQNQIETKDYSYHLLIDGNYFNAYCTFDKTTKKFVSTNHVCVKGGDDTFSSIAAASILAKVARDAYIEELCALHPELSERYGIDSNKGYGAKRHLDGISEHGITKWHRKSFGPCKTKAQIETQSD
jgi:ribonuclease HII